MKKVRVLEYVNLEFAILDARFPDDEFKAIYENEKGGWTIK